MSRGGDVLSRLYSPITMAQNPGAGYFQDDEICFRNKATYLFVISSYRLVCAVISFNFYQEDKFKFNTTQLRVIGERT